MNSTAHDDGPFPLVVDAVDELDLERALGAVTKGLLGRARAEPNVGRFVLLDRVGSGGMGVVYAAFDPKLDRRVALKLLHSERSDAQAQARLVREARTLAKVRHPNIVAVHEIGEVDGRVFVAMDLVEGQPWSRWIMGGHAWSKVLEIALQAGEGVAAAHAAGIVHRDFKPANVMLGRDGRAVVLDFGLARAPAPEPSSSDVEVSLEDDSFKTRQGAVLGTPAYMSPEQHLGLEATPYSDQFSFCASVYEALYRERPFAGTNRTAVLDAIERGDVRPAPADSSVPHRVRRVVLRGLDGDPAQRWPSMDALLEALRACLRPRWRAAAWVGGVALAGTAVALSTARAGVSCDEQAAGLAAAWDPQTSEDIERALSSVDHPSAQVVPAQVVADLDAYARAWTQARSTACERQRVSADQRDSAAVFACLEGQWRWFTSSLDLLRNPDQAILLEANNLIPTVPQLEVCTLADPAEVLDPLEVARARAEVDRLVLEATALARAGQHAEAQVRTREARRTAHSIEGAHGLDARVKRLEGVVLRLAGDRNGARAHLEAAVVAAERSGDVVARLEATRSLAAALVHDGRVDEAARLVAQVEAAHERFEARPWLWDAELLEIRAALAQEREAHEETVALAQQLVALVEKHPAAPPHLDLDARATLLRARGARGDVDDAQRAQWDDLRARAERYYGPVHASVAQAIEGAANVEYARSNLDEATALGKEALSIREQLVPADHPSLIGPLSRLGASIVREQPEAGLQAFQRAVDIARVHRPAYDRQLSTAAYNTSGVLMMLGRHEEALALQQEVVAIETDLKGADHGDVVDSMITVATGLIMLERYDAAKNTLLDALAREQAARGLSTARAQNTLLSLSEVTYEQDDLVPALAYAERATALLEVVTARPELEVATHLNHAIVLAQIPGRLEDANEALVRAEKLAEDEPRILATTHESIARLRNRLDVRRVASAP